MGRAAAELAQSRFYHCKCRRMVSIFLVTASGNLLLSNDPLLHDIDLPLRAVLYPLGFRLNLATNSRDVIAAAGESWGLYTAEFARQPLEIRIIVQPDGGPVEEQPLFRGQGDLYSIVYDRHNFGVYDSSSMFGYCCLSRQTAADHLRLRTHFLEAMAYALLAQRHAVPMHAAAVMRGGAGFLLFGESGAGKSTLAYACARAGWTFVSDDASWLTAGEDSRTVIGRPGLARFRADAPGLFPELARYAAAQRPNGKLTIEASTSDLPSVRTAVRCTADHLVMLDRRPTAPQLVSIPAAQAVDRLLAYEPSYGERVRDLYERTLHRLRSASAWRLEYETLDQALELLNSIPEPRP
jgi:hypothetical protein